MDTFNNEIGHYLNYTRITELYGVEEYNWAPRRVVCDTKYGALNMTRNESYNLSQEWEEGFGLDGLPTPEQMKVN
jgi:hypothetical protein